MILFGFQPNYRGQSIVTWPLLFNAIAGGGSSDERVGKRGVPELQPPGEFGGSQFLLSVWWGLAGPAVP